MVLAHSSSIQWQFWLSLLQLVFGGYGFGFSISQVEPICRNPVSYPSWFVVFIALLIVFWVLILANTLFILIFDPKRTNTYLGCHIAQLGINAFIAALLLVYLVIWAASYSLYKAPNSAIIMFVAAILVCSLCSLSLLLITLQSTTRLNRMWTCNTKDIFLRRVAPFQTDGSLSIFGSPRDTPAPLWEEVKSGLYGLRQRIASTFGPPLFSLFVSIKSLLYFLFFRRVKPVETRMYAFTRNGFAIIATGFLIVRTITALLQAQNEIGTRMVSADCSQELYWPQVLVVCIIRQSNQSYMCMLLAYLDAHRNTTYQGNYSQNINISIRSDSMSNDIFDGISIDNKSALKIHIEARGVNGTSLLESSPMPPIWITNLMDGRTWSQLSDGEAMYKSVHTHAAPIWLPSWGIHPGTHVETEAKLITRKRLKSSIWMDIILSSKPTYRFISLYHIVESPVGIVNLRNNSIATATIHLSMRSGFAYFRDRPIDPGFVCDFIEDYRTGTILEAIGSVGGLFALLQAAHVLLFGRPLLWGLTGAKLITPFGLLGVCSSIGFKRRLREQYHRTSANGDSDAIRIGLFLRDFVVDFGPADIELERHHSHTQQPATPSFKLTSDDSEEDIFGSQVPLMQQETCSSPAPRGEA
ncbi:unnamed protein product [Rhizoctonia solani]|uniref:Transmembrane protein n=1 Tax=Rhizoctonia solani TaxID=456999 RepID=A0A8H3AWW6_9AGAM|nr:unnamed protein product [Rhizoctonia solani]